MTTTLGPDDVQDIQAEVVAWLDEVVPDQYVMALHVTTDGSVVADCVPKEGIETAPLTPDGLSLVTQPRSLTGAPASLLALA